MNKMILLNMQVVGGGGCVFVWVEGNGWVGTGRRTRIARRSGASLQLAGRHTTLPTEHQQSPPIIITPH